MLRSVSSPAAVEGKVDVAKESDIAVAQKVFQWHAIALLKASLQALHNQTYHCPLAERF